MCLQPASLFPRCFVYEVGSITNANGPISQQLRNIAQKFKKAAQTTFINCTEKKSFVS